MRSTWSALLLPALLQWSGAAAAAAVPATSWKSLVAQVTRNPNFPVDVVDKLEESVMPKVESWLTQRAAAGRTGNCTMDALTVRMEWSDMPEAMRQDYVRATQCLMKLPPKCDTKRFPGANSRFDDFVAYHMTHAQMLHDTLHLFAAHRYYVYVYEQALRDECGYKGYQPYMNYDRYTVSPEKSPLFNGNASSMGGNGEPDPNYEGVRQSGRIPNIIKSGGGGGCVRSGPFSDMVVSLGPVMATSPSIPKNPRRDGTGANPRCLRRDINVNAALGATANRTYDLLMEKDMNGFYNKLLGTPPPKGDPYPWGVHTAGHYIHAVDPGGDPSTSPGDPVFYFHHGMLDRIWWIWQMQDPENRINAFPNLGMGSGGHNHGKRALDPATAVVDLEWLAPPIKLMDAMDQLGGNNGMFCYVYV